MGTVPRAEGQSRRYEFHTRPIGANYRADIDRVGPRPLLSRGDSGGDVSRNCARSAVGGAGRRARADLSRGNAGVCRSSADAPSTFRLNLKTAGPGKAKM